MDSELKKQLITGAVGLLGVYIVYKFVTAEIKGLGGAAADAVTSTVKSGYDAANAGSVQLSNKISQATGVDTGNSYLNILTALNPASFLGSTIGNSIKKGATTIYDWISNSGENPKVNVYDDSSKTVNGIPIYIVKPDGAPKSIFTLESLSEDIPFLNAKGQ